MSEAYTIRNNRNEINAGVEFACHTCGYTKHYYSAELIAYGLDNYDFVTHEINGKKILICRECRSKLVDIVTNTIKRWLRTVKEV